MTTTDWLIFGLLGWLVVCLLAIIISHMINAEWDSADAPTYRTADADALERNLRDLRARVPDAAPRQKARAGIPASYSAERPRRKPGA